LASILRLRMESAYLNTTARSTIRPVRSPLTRRSRSASGCSRSTRFCDLTRVSCSYSGKIEVTYKTIHRRVERFVKRSTRRHSISGPVEIDEFYVSPGLKSRERDRWSLSRDLSRNGRGTFQQDKPPVFVLVDWGTEKQYFVPAKSADESTIRFLLADLQQESLTVYNDGFCAYDPRKKMRDLTATMSFTETLNTRTKTST